MIIIFIRTIIIFVSLLIIMRLMGKRQIGEMQSFELIITLIIADLAVIPMADVSIPLIYGIVAILALFILHQLIFIVEKCGGFFKKFINGKTSIVINTLGVDFNELKKNNLDVSDLIEAMRGAGYFALDDAKYAVFESNGKLSVMQNDNALSSKSLPIVLVSNGKIDKNNIQKISKDKAWITNLVSIRGKKLKNIGVLTINGNGEIYMQEKFNRYEKFTIDLGGIKW